MKKDELLARHPSESWDPVFDFAAIERKAKAGFQLSLE